MPQTLPKYGQTPFQPKERAGECCHCNDDHIKYGCFYDAVDESDTEDKEDGKYLLEILRVRSLTSVESDTATEISGICYCCSDDDRHRKCPRTCGKAVKCERRAEYSGTCNHCKSEIIYRFCPCICGNSVTFGREEEFGIRPIVDVSSAKKKKKLIPRSRGQKFLLLRQLEMRRNPRKRDVEILELRVLEICHPCQHWNLKTKNTHKPMLRLLRHFVSCCNLVALA